MKIVVVEDETAATLNLLSIISEVCPGSEVLATLESVSDAVEWFNSHESPDVVFMDIHLADGDAFRIFEMVDIPTPVVFTTAYDKYALDAFKVNSIDYLLKPIKTEDMRRAIDKLGRLTNSEKATYINRVQDVIGNRGQNTLLIHVRDKIIPLKIDDIAFCYTYNEKVTIYTFDGSEYPYDKSLDHMISILDHDKFFRANRQFIISRGALTDISVWFGSRLALNLNLKTPEKIVVSKARVPEFKQWVSK